MTKRINLALQGGGAHGAFTWGALDAILDRDDLEIAAISGTSAGALNGAALKAGLAKGGREAARANLAWLWDQVGAQEDPGFASALEAWSPALVSDLIEMSPPYMLWDAVSRGVSPYMTPRFTSAALERIVERFDFDDVCYPGGPGLCVCATNVRTGKIRIFTGPEVSAQAILASACLPTLFPAVEIEGEAYWDGGYTGNPALFPLYHDDLPRDVVIVNINPLERERVPVSAADIQNRINEISFNSSLLRELRAIEFVQRLLHDGKIQEGAMKDVLVHMIADDALMRQLSVATKIVPNAAVIHQLRAAGRAAAEAFLDAHWDDLGSRSSVDLRAMFA